MTVAVQGVGIIRSVRERDSYIDVGVSLLELIVHDAEPVPGEPTPRLKAVP